MDMYMDEIYDLLDEYWMPDDMRDTLIYELQGESGKGSKSPKTRKKTRDLERLANNLKWDIRDSCEALIYNAYTPTEYVRTKMLMDGILSLSPTVDVKRQEIIIDLEIPAFYHPSISKRNPHDSYVPFLMDFGWKTRLYDVYKERYKNSRGGYLTHFLSFEGTGFIRKAIARFNAKHDDVKAVLRVNGMNVTNGSASGISYLKK